MGGVAAELLEPDKAALVTRPLLELLRATEPPASGIFCVGARETLIDAFPHGHFEMDAPSPRASRRRLDCDETSRAAGRGIRRFGPPVAQAKRALILIHGRGSSPEDIAGLTDALDADGFAFLAPGAESGTWYPQRFFVPLLQNEPWLSSALKTIDDLVRETMAAGVASERIGLIGFSQGACLALEHAARAGARCAFVAGLSGALIGPLDTLRPARDLTGLPILLGCAEEDAHIPRLFVERSAVALSAMNAAVTKQIFPGAAHTVVPQEVAWINRQLASLRL